MPNSPPPRLKPAIGVRFGRLTVCALAPERHVSPSGRRHRRWICICDCGRVTRPTTRCLMTGHALSCGCLRLENQRREATKHGQSRAPENQVWRDMRSRCRNPRHRCFDRYGGRGIAVCERWDSFAAFLGDMGPRPTPSHTIERKDNDGPYCPKNCVWATHAEQQRNRSTTRQITLNGRTMCLTDWAKEAGVSHQLISNRLAAGWSVEEALTRPVDEGRSHPRTPPDA